jgi:hypothetical protein
MISLHQADALVGEDEACGRILQAFNDYDFQVRVEALLMRLV